MTPIQAANLGKQHGLQGEKKFFHRNQKPFKADNLNKAYLRGYEVGWNMKQHIAVHGTWTNRENKIIGARGRSTRDQASELDEYQLKAEKEFKARIARN